MASSVWADRGIIGIGFSGVSARLPLRSEYETTRPNRERGVSPAAPLAAVPARISAPKGSSVRSGGERRRGISHDEGIGRLALQPRGVSSRGGDAPGFGRGVRVPGVRSDVQPSRSPGQAHGVKAQEQARSGREHRESVPLRGVQAVVRAQRHADAAHASAHGRQTVHVPGVRTSVLAIRPSLDTPADSHRGEAVQVSAVSVRSMSQRHDHASYAHSRALRTRSGDDQDRTAPLIRKN